MYAMEMKTLLPKCRILAGESPPLGFLESVAILGLATLWQTDCLERPTKLSLSFVEEPR